MTTDIHSDAIYTNHAIADANRRFIVRRFRAEHEARDVITYLGQSLDIYDIDVKSPEEYHKMVADWIVSINREFFSDIDNLR